MCPVWRPSVSQPRACGRKPTVCRRRRRSLWQSGWRQRSCDTKSLALAPRQMTPAFVAVRMRCACALVAVPGCAASARTAEWADPSTTDLCSAPKPIQFEDWVREYVDVKTSMAASTTEPGAPMTTTTTYTVRGRPGKKDAVTELTRDDTPARWAISDRVDFDGAVVIGADFKGVTFLNGITACKSRFEGGASFKVCHACVCAGAVRACR